MLNKNSGYKDDIKIQRLNKINDQIDNFVFCLLIGLFIVGIFYAVLLDARKNKNLIVFQNVVLKEENIIDNCKIKQFDPITPSLKFDIHNIIYVGDCEIIEIEGVHYEGN